MDDRIFKIFENPRIFIYKIREIFLFYNVYKEIMFIIEKEDGLVSSYSKIKYVNHDKI